jgi:hypothetical protein
LFVIFFFAFNFGAKDEESWVVVDTCKVRTY